MADQLSNSKFLQVLLSEANPDAGWYIEIVDTVNQTVQSIGTTVVSAFFKPTMNAVGTGYIEVPADDPTIPDIIDVSIKHSSLMRVYLDGLCRYVFFADDKSESYQEEGGSELVKISGFGMEAVSQRAVIGNADSPAVPSLSPTWIYGSTDNIVENPGFEDGAIPIENPGGEDGNNDEGYAEGWESLGDDLTSPAVGIMDPDEAYEGDWYVKVFPSDNHSGVTQSFECTPNKVYHIQARVKEPTAAGMRVTLAVGGAKDLESTGTYGNNFEYNNEIMAELGNVARNPAHNGLPGGATDGSWQVLDVEVMTGNEQTSLVISIQDDHHGSGGVHEEFWVDGVVAEGWGIGLEPWTAFDPENHASNSFRLTTYDVYEGEYSCLINPLGKWAGIQQIIELNPSTLYTFNLKAWAESVVLGSGDAWKLVVRRNDGLGTQLATTEDITPTVNSFDEWTLTFKTPDDAEPIDAILRFAYVGPNNPNPMHVDSVSGVPGMPRSTAGAIIHDVLDAIQSRDELLYLQTTFTDEYDSKGEPWASTLALDIDPGASLYDVLSRMVALGHEWRIVPVSFDEGGNTGFQLDVYVARATNGDTGVGVNWSGREDAPMIMPSDATVGGRLNQKANLANRVIVAGEGGQWTQAEQSGFTNYQAGYGIISEYISAGTGVDQETLAAYAEARLAELRDLENAIQLAMQRSGNMRPFLHFSLGDSLLIDLPPYFVSDEHQRIRAIATTLAGEGSDITFVIDVSRVLYEQEMAIYATVAQLAERSPTDTSGVGTGRVGGGGASSVVTGSGSTGSTGVEKHSHDLKKSDILNKTLSGDVSGTLPGPINVNSIKGVPFDVSIPTGTADEFIYYDRDTKTFIVGGRPVIENIGDLGDVDMTTDAPAADDFMVFDGSDWVPVAVELGATELDELTDVDLSTAAPSADDVLTFDGDDWVPVPGGSSGASELNELDDVNLDTYAPTDGQALVYAAESGVDYTDTPPGFYASSTYSTYYPANAWRAPTSLWVSGSTSATEQWWFADLGSGVEIALDFVRFEMDATVRYARKIELKYSDDASTWTSASDIMDVDHGTTQEIECTETDPHRYWLLKFTDHAGGSSGIQLRAVYFFETTAGLWVPGESAGALADLSDVDVVTTAPATDDVLTFDGTDWVPAEGGGGGGGTEAPSYTIAGRITKTANQAISGSTNTEITFQDTEFDEGDFVDLDEDGFVAPADGVYRFDAGLGLEFESNDCRMFFYVNGAAHDDQSNQANREDVVTAWRQFEGGQTMLLEEGDIVTVALFAGIGGNVRGAVDSAVSSWFSGYMIGVGGGGGAAAIAASAAKMILTTSQSIPHASWTTLSGDGVEYDTDDWWNATNPTRLTAPHAGIFQFTASYTVSYASYTAKDNIGHFYVYDSTDTLKSVVTPQFRESGIYSFGNSASVGIELDAGDYVIFEVYQGSGATRTLLSAYTNFSVFEIGGGASKLDELNDVDLTTTTPVAGDLLTFDGDDWVPYNRIGARVWRSAAKELANETAWNVEWDNLSHEKGGTLWSSTVNPSRLTIPAGGDGYYVCTGGFALQENMDNDSMRIRFLLNGVDQGWHEFGGGAGSAWTAPKSQNLIYAEAGDYIEMQIWQRRGGTSTIWTGSTLTFMAIARVG